MNSSDDDSDFQIKVPVKTKKAVTKKKPATKKQKPKPTAELTEEQRELLQQQKEAKERVHQACKLGMFTTAKKSAMQTTDVSKLVSKSIRSLISAGHCHDILKKASSHLAAKYVHVLPGRIQNYIQSTAGAEIEALGVLKGLDTLTPTLYINFPTGRLKLFGALAMLQNNFLVAQFNKHHVSVGDPIDSLVVYSECCWVGTAEENPDEKPLPVPESVVKILDPAAPTMDDDVLKPKMDQPTVVSDDDPDTETSAAIAISDEEPVEKKSAVVHRPRRHVAEVSYVDLDNDKDMSADTQSDSEVDTRPAGPKYIIGKKSPLKATDTPHPSAQTNSPHNASQPDVTTSRRRSAKQHSGSDSGSASDNTVGTDDEEPEYVPKPTSRTKRTRPADSQQDTEAQHVPRKTTRTAQNGTEDMNGTTFSEDSDNPPPLTKSPAKVANTAKLQVDSKNAPKGNGHPSKKAPATKKMRQGTLSSMMQAKPAPAETSSSTSSAKKKKGSEYIEIDLDGDDPFSLDVTDVATKSPFKKSPFKKTPFDV